MSRVWCDGAEWRTNGSSSSGVFAILSAWTVLCAALRLGTPREFALPTESRFAGEVRRGLGDDGDTLKWRGRTIVLLGHGPYALENMRTGLEHGVMRVSFLCRRHGIICPDALDYALYVRPRDNQIRHPQAGGAIMTSLWRNTYSISSATPPEGWKQGRFLPDGHALSIADVYFVASYLKVVHSQVGNATGVEARVVLADKGPPLEADVLLKCVGFEVNEENEAMAGRSHMKAGWVLDAGCFAIWEVRPDGGGVP